MGGFGYEGYLMGTTTNYMLSQGRTLANKYMLVFFDKNDFYLLWVASPSPPFTICIYPVLR